MKNIKNIKASLFIVGAFFSMAAGAASFDCAKASSRVENAICASPTLSRLDSELADAYGVILLTNADAEGVKSAQRVWLRDTRNKCVDDACLETVYKQRIAALRGPDPVDAPSRAEIEADDANMPSDQELAEQEQKRLAEEQAAKARADELSAKAQAEVAAKAKAEAEAAELAKKQKEEAETKKAVQARQQQLYMAIGVGVLFTVGFFGWLFLGKRKANPSTVNTSKSSSRNDQANQGDAQEALGRAQRELLHKQQAEIESLKAKLAKEAEIVSNGPSTQTASIQGVLSNVGEPQEELNSKNQSSKIGGKEEAVDYVKNGVPNPHLVNLLKILLEKFKSLSLKIKMLIGAIAIVFLLINFGSDGGESSGEGKLSGDAKNTQSTSKTNEDKSISDIKKLGDSLIKTHNYICNTSVQEMVEKCIAKNPNEPNRRNFCIDGALNAKRGEDCSGALETGAAPSQKYMTLTGELNQKMKNLRPGCPNYVIAQANKQLIEARGLLKYENPNSAKRLSDNIAHSGLVILRANNCID